MCLSQSVSFAASGFLLVGGAFAVTKAWQINRRYLPVALMPVFAGLQQFMEGNVWLGVNAGDPVATLLGALGFIFFTLAASFVFGAALGWLITKPAIRLGPVYIMIATLTLTDLAGLIGRLYVPLSGGGLGVYGRGHVVLDLFVGDSINQAVAAEHKRALIREIVPFVLFGEQIDLRSRAGTDGASQGVSQRAARRFFFGQRTHTHRLLFQGVVAGQLLQSLLGRIP